MNRNEQRIHDLAQSIYLAKNNRYNDVEGDELTLFIDETIDWVNQYLPELEMEADWNFLRANDYQVGSISGEDSTSFRLRDDIRKLVYSPYRDLTLRHDGTVVATFQLVSPNQITDPTNPSSYDRATVIQRQVMLSRPLKESEVGAVAQADVIRYMPRLARNNTETLDLLEPVRQLIVLGVAKNATLPDIVQGGVSPSLTQKYADLLEKFVRDNNATSGSYEVPREDFSWISGVW